VHAPGGVEDDDLEELVCVLPVADDSTAPIESLHLGAHQRGSLRLIGEPLIVAPCPHGPRYRGVGQTDLPVRQDPGAAAVPVGSVYTPRGYRRFRREATMKPGYIDEKEAVLKRLRRIEGQIRGLQRMVEEERYCVNILEQISAATEALRSVALELLDDHLAHCVADAVKGGGDESTRKLNEASAAIGRLVRS
jgi:CsoR family transcriptional regulator, copper-sensing transcriptional repressor